MTISRKVQYTKLYSDHLGFIRIENDLDECTTENPFYIFSERGTLEGNSIGI